MPETAVEMTTVEALARLARQRDPLAWSELLRLHGDAIHRVCRRILGGEALADDACQETLLQLRDRAGLFAAPGSNAEAAARSWIMRVACHTALQMLRKRKAERLREDRAGRSVSENRNPEPDGMAHAVNAERLDAVRRELAAMPERERLPLVLHYHAGLGFEDVAAALGCPVNTAKTRVHRGLERLRERLALLGLVLPLGTLSGLLSSDEAGPGAGKDGGVRGALPRSERMQAWQRLLNSSQSSTLPFFEPEGAWSTMAKIGTTVAALALAAVLVLTASTLKGADQSKAAGGGEAHVAKKEPEARTKAGEPAGDPQERRGAPSERSTKGPEKPATADEKRAVAEGINAFAADFYAKLKGDPKKNLFFSPYSISTALAMTYAGARGNTADEMAKALHFTVLNDRLHAACGGLIADLNADQKDGKPRGFKLAVANRLFGAQKYKFLPEFLDLNEKAYGAPLESMDFLGATEASRKAINAWVEKKTQDKIKDLILAGQLDPGTSLVLVNAIYFKGDWLEQFDKKQTKDEPFNVAVDKQVTAATMHRTDHWMYYEEEGKFQVLELPYVNRELSMLVFLPAQVDGLAGFENTLTAENIKKWTGGLTRAEVILSLPKFKMTWGTENIANQLQELGIKDAFVYPQADFSGMDGSKLLYISLVLHKAFVDVNEEGTEAAAATAVVMAPGAAPVRDRPKPKVFKTDRPFCFAIRDNTSGAILFIGRVANPIAEK
ncbi:MAG: sigma-70 family RNA polymerase sigma factor [Planctomycetes bacterium]|nr:sigma-70 family RNA polymerase sigma factor [Planctomycetota bacterium]